MHRREGCRDHEHGTATSPCCFTCGNCGATFVSKETMMDHLLSVHTGKLPYKCRDDCGSTFKSDKNLKLHIHLQSKPSKCGKCTSAYTSKRALKFHVVAVHSGKKPHKCGDSKQSYVTASGLKRHELSIHRGGRHFVCGNCRSTFVCKSNLMRLRLFLFYHAMVGQGLTSVGNVGSFTWATTHWSYTSHETTEEKGLINVDCANSHMLLKAI